MLFPRLEVTPLGVKVSVLPSRSTAVCRPLLRSITYDVPLLSVSLNVGGSKIPSEPKEPPDPLSPMKNSESSPSTSRVEGVSVPGCATNDARARPGKNVLASTPLRSKTSWCPSGHTTLTEWGTVEVYSSWQKIIPHWVERALQPDWPSGIARAIRKLAVPTRQPTPKSPAPRS